MDKKSKLLEDADPKLLKTVIGKILSQHLEVGSLSSGRKIGLKIDQTLTQDATGTVAYLESEALGIARAKTELSVSYIDHNTLKMDYKNADDHVYLQSVAAKYGLTLSKAGNGICHQVHLERYAKPGKPCSAQTVIRRLQEAWDAFLLAPAGWMWHWQLPEGRSI